MSKFTSGPWEISRHRPLKTLHNPKSWTIVKHEFPECPYEGELEEEWGVYPPLGESGPVALVAGEANARLIAAAPDLLAACEQLLEVEVRAASVEFLNWDALEKIQDAKDEALEAARAAIRKAKGEQ